jgi:hypothetical protein
VADFYSKISRNYSKHHKDRLSEFEVPLFVLVGDFDETVSELSRDSDQSPCARQVTR